MSLVRYEEREGGRRERGNMVQPDGKSRALERSGKPLLWKVEDSSVY